MPDPRPRLHVCVTCRAGQDLAPTDPRPGQILYDAVVGLLHADALVTVHPVSCLGLCDRGCAVAMSAPNKWGTLFGGLDASAAADLLAYGTAYVASPTGTVLPSRRPTSLGPMLGRLPAPEMAA